MSEGTDQTPVKPVVVVISSHVIRGTVGNRAAVFALETLGFQVWAIPTVTMAWHPGHGPTTRMAPDDDTFASLLDDVGNAPWTDEIGAILTGYMANAEQVLNVANLVRTLKQKNPDLLYVCDPVIGDAEDLYVAEDTAIALRDNLLPMCNLTTPNKFELAWLAGRATSDDVGDILETAASLGPQQVVVTSCPGDAAGVGNLYYCKNRALIASHDKIANPPNGPGDLTAALFLAHRLEGMSTLENLRQTTASVFELLRKSTTYGDNELRLERDVYSLVEPRISVKIREISLK